MENLHPAIAQFMYAQAPTPAAKRPMVIRRRVTAQLEASAAAADAAQTAVKYREFPELPPGVIPRDETQLRYVSAPLTMDGKAVLAADGAIVMDEAPTVLLPGEVPRTKLATDQNPFASNGWGFGAAGGYGTGLWFPGYPYLAELTQISEYRAPCETIATEMTRKWFELQSKGGAKNKVDSDPEKETEGEGDDPEIAADSDDAVKGDKSDRIAKIMARVEELKVRDHFRRAALIDCEFGASYIYLNIGDADERVRQLPLELTPQSIKVGSLKGIQTIEPYWVTPYSWNSMYPERPDFYKPVSRYIMGRKTHSTRILTFIGREVPDLLKPAYNFGGISLQQLGQQSVNFWLRTRKAVNDLINNFSIPVLSTDLAATLEEGGELGSGLIPRLQQLTLTRNNQMVAAINKDTEELAFAEATLASLDKLQAQSQEHMAAVWRIPLVKLTGITPSGLNASSEGEIQVWYDLINAMQISLFEPNLYALLKVIQLDLDGTIDDDLVIHWVSLDEPTAKELSEIRKSDADAGVGYINAGVISPEEERERLQNDPLSGYENLDGPPPEPQQVDPETGEPLGTENPGTPPGGGPGDDEATKALSGFSMDAAKFEEGKHKRGPGGHAAAPKKTYKDPNDDPDNFATYRDVEGHTSGEPGEATLVKKATTTTVKHSAAPTKDPDKIKAAEASAAKISAMMTGEGGESEGSGEGEGNGAEAEEKPTQDPKSYEAVKPVAASEKSPRAAQGGASKAAFVNEFMASHKNREDDMARLGKLSDAKLNQAYKLLKDHNVNDPDAKYMRELIRDVLKTSGTGR